MLSPTGGVFLLLFCVTIALSLPDVDIESRIVGGQEIPITTRKFQVAVLTNNSYLCAGVIISYNWILTAAHCVHNQLPTNMKIVVGTNSPSSEGTTYNVTQLAYPSSYDPQTSKDDIALLQVSPEISFTPIYKKVLGVKILVGRRVTAISLASSDPLPGSSSTLSGYGLKSVSFYIFFFLVK